MVDEANRYLSETEPWKLDRPTASAWARCCTRRRRPSATPTRCSPRSCRTARSRCTRSSAAPATFSPMPRIDEVDRPGRRLAASTRSSRATTSSVGPSRLGVEAARPRHAGGQAVPGLHQARRLHRRGGARAAASGLMAGRSKGQRLARAAGAVCRSRSSTTTPTSTRWSRGGADGWDCVRVPRCSARARRGRGRDPHGAGGVRPRRGRVDVVGRSARTPGCSARSPSTRTRRSGTRASGGRGRRARPRGPVRRPARRRDRPRRRRRARQRPHPRHRRDRPGPLPRRTRWARGPAGVVPRAHRPGQGAGPGAADPRPRRARRGGRGPARRRRARPHGLPLLLRRRGPGPARGVARLVPLVRRSGLVRRRTSRLRDALRVVPRRSCSSRPTPPT